MILNRGSYIEDTAVWWCTAKSLKRVNTMTVNWHIWEPLKLTLSRNKKATWKLNGKTNKEN